MEDIRTNDMDQTQTSKRRSYPADFKAQIVRQTQTSGASVAGIALQHRINPVTVHRWIRESRPIQSSDVAAFLPLRLDPSGGVATGTPANGTVIHIELPYNGATIRMQWPVACAVECAAWVREVLK